MQPRRILLHFSRRERGDDANAENERAARLCGSYELAWAVLTELSVPFVTTLTARCRLLTTWRLTVWSITLP
jgi:hypothetical protein